MYVHPYTGHYLQSRRLRVNRRGSALYGGIALAIVACLLVSAYCALVWLSDTQNPARESEKEEMTLTVNTPEPYTINTVGNADMSVAALSETLGIGLFYNSTAGELQAVTVEISGNINLNAVGAATVDTNAKNTSFAIAKLSGTTAIAVYQDSVSGDILGRIITVSGSTISNVGASNSLDTDGGIIGGTGSIAVAGLGAGAAITAYRDENDSNKAKGRALDISGDTITPGTELPIINNAVFNVSLVTVKDSSSQAIFTCLDNGTTPANRPSAHVLTKSGSTLSAGSQALLEATATPSGRVGIASMSGSVAVATYENNGGTLQGQVLDISGTSISTNSSSEIDSATILTNVMAGRIGANTAIAVYRDGSNDTYAVEVLVSGSSVSGDTAVLVSTTAGQQSDAITTVSPYTLVMYEDEMVIVTSSNAQPDVTDNGTYVLSIALDNEETGNTGYVTLWRDGTLYLQCWDVDSMTINDEISLGAATLTEVQNKSRIAYPFAGSSSYVWVFGNMDTPAYLTGTVWAMESNSCGASGSWSRVPGLSSWAGADVLDSLFVSPDISGLGDRIFTGIRRRSANAPELWRGVNQLAFISAIPFPTGTGVEHRGMHISRQSEISVGSASLGTGTSRILSALDPYNAWNDITNNYPSGTVEVLRYF